MLTDYSWDMTGYAPKHKPLLGEERITLVEAERIFQLQPEPPEMENLNAYVLLAILKKELKYFSFFLHHYERFLNQRIRSVLLSDTNEAISGEKFLDIKLSCQTMLLEKLADYDPEKGAEFTTYIYPFVKDEIQKFLMGEESWSVSSLSSYKMLRTMAWMWRNEADPVAAFSEKYNCDPALAQEYLDTVRGLRNRHSFFKTVRDEDSERTQMDVTQDEHWDYTERLWNGMRASQVERAFDKLNYREQTLLEKRLSICMNCGRVESWEKRPTFEELAILFEGSSASGAERAYRKAVDHLTEHLVADGALHAIRLKQTSKTKRKKKIAAATYLYQADCDGEWGEVVFDFENGTAQIIRLADGDTIRTNVFAGKAIAYLLGCDNDKLPKETLLALDPWE